MTKAKGHKAGKTHSTKSQQWAAQVLSISENTRQGGIEIRFDAEPSPSLQPKLRVMGFRHSRTKSMWYGEKTDQAWQFAQQVKTTLPVNADGPELQLAPSVDAVKANLEKKAFSYVMYTLKNGQTKSYVLFEPSKPRAEVIAANFSGKEFGDELLAFAVLPRTRMREARILFDEGKIIYPAGLPEQTGVTKDKKNAMSNTGPHQDAPGAKVPVQTILLTTEAVSRDPDFSAGVELHTWKEANAYVKSKIGKNASDVYYKISWQSGDHFGGWVDIEPPDFFNRIENPLSNHVTTYLTNYSKADEQDPFYDKESVEFAKHLLSTCQFEDLAEPRSEAAVENQPVDLEEATSDDQRQLERQALDKFYKWVVRQQDLNVKPTEVSLELMSNWFHENLPELSSDAISSIWKSHQRILKSLEVMTRKKNLRSPFDSIYKKILKVIPGLIEHIKTGKLAGKSRVDPGGGLMDLNYDFITHDKNGHPIIALSHYFKQNGDMVADPDMQIRLIPEMEIAEAMTYQDQFGFKQVYSEQDGKSFVNRRYRNELNRFLNTWLTNIIHQGHKIDLSTVAAEQIAVEVQEAKDQSFTLLPGTPVFNPEIMARLITAQNYLLNAWGLSYAKNVLQQRTFSAEDITQLRAFFTIYVQQDQPMQVKYLELYRKQHTQTVDLIFQDTGTPLPNVLVPSGTREPFFSHDWRTYDMRSLLQNSFASLTALNNDNLNNASPLQLYELAQLGNPSSYRIAVSQDKLIDIWRKRGKELFDTLGFPTNPHYPYADLIAGYENMMSLRDLLNDNNTTGDEWWIAAALYRPVADLAKAKAILDEWIDKKKREKQSYLTADGQRPRPNYKHHVEQIARTIGYLEESQAVLQGYHQQADNTQTNLTLPIGEEHREPVNTGLQEAEETSTEGANDPLTNDSGVYTKETAGENLEHISIPMPKTAQYTAEIQIAKTSAGTYKKGITAFKNFGDSEGMGSAPSIFDVDYPSRNAALKAALAEHEAFLERLLASEDSILNNEGKKNKQLSMALKAVIDFAREKGIELDEASAEDTGALQQDADKTPEPNTHNSASSRDPLADEDGFYTTLSAGENFETLEIPMPKSAAYSARVFLVKTSAGNYRQGISHSKEFGDVSYFSVFPSTGTEAYPTRKAALKAALLHHEQDLEVQLGRKDTILNNEASQRKRLTLAMNALKQFAKESGISLEAKPDPEDGFIPGLETAYWDPNDTSGEANRIMVKGQAFHQARLRELIGARLETLPVAALDEIRVELAGRFKERRPFSSYEQGLLTVNKKGEARRASLIAAYVDDIIIDHDLKDKDQGPVMSFLFDLLFSGSTRLVDIPRDSRSSKEPGKPAKRQSQHQLNQEIEAFIDRKDKTGAFYDEQEKNYLRQYSGSGGLLSQGAAGRGTLYEYYTPEGIVKKMWDIAYHYGYDGGRILEPAVGTGNFLKYAPKNAIVFGFETNHYACRVAQILYPNAHIHEKAFETHFFAGNIHLKDKFENPGYSLVIGNPPYGSFTGKYAGLGEKRHTGVTEYDQYFTLRSLDLLKPGGLLVFLVPSYFMLSAQKYNTIKEKISASAEWVDAYRFPEGAFPNTSIGTDILVLRKRLNQHPINPQKK